MNRAHSDHCGAILSRSDGESTSRLRVSVPSKLGKACVFVVGCCLLTTTVGCMRLPIRHGMIVKGDWSLEMNRIPWMKGRGDDYQQPSECGMATSVCATEVDSPFVAGAPQLATRAHCGAPGCGSSAQNQAVSYHNHARFHPVPTRSVFSTDAAMGGAPSPATFPPARSVPKSLEPPPVPPDMEDIPTPAPLPPDSPDDQAAIHRNAGNRQVSWVFSAETDAGDSVPDGGQRYAADPAARAVR